MKKLIGLLLITMLVLIVTGCNVGLSNKYGFSELIVKGTNLTRYGDPDAEENEAEEYEIAAEDLEAATVKIGSDEKSLGETFVLKTGTYDVYIKAGKFAETLEVKVVDINKTTVLEPKVVLKKLPFNAWKFIFNPETYGVTVENQVHLVGTINGWTADNMGFPLIKKSDGTWSAVFNVAEGEMFKFMYDSTDWGDGNDIGDDDGNITIGTNDAVVAPVEAWQFIFNPVGVTGLPEALGENPIETVSLAGGFGEVDGPTWWGEGIPYHTLVKQADDTWVGYFEAEEGTNFKFVVNGSIWVGSTGVGGFGDDYAIGQNPEVVTKDF